MAPTWVGAIWVICVGIWCSELSGARHPWGQPWRALKRGLARLITKTLPCRLITREPGLFFRDLIELRTFTVASLRREA